MPAEQIGPGPTYEGDGWRCECGDLNVLHEGFCRCGAGGPENRIEVRRSVFGRALDRFSAAWEANRG